MSPVFRFPIFWRIGDPFALTGTAGGFARGILWGSLLLMVFGGGGVEGGEKSPWQVWVPATGPARPAAIESIEKGGPCIFRWKENEESERETRRAWSLTEMVRWGHPPKPGGGVLIFLSEGSRVSGDLMEVENDRCRLTSPIFGELEFSLTAIKAIVFHLPVDSREKSAFLQEVREGTISQDRFFLSNRDVIGGQLIKIKDGQLQWKASGEDFSLSLNRLRAIQLLPLTVKRPDLSVPLAKVGFRDGTLLRVASFHTRGERIIVERRPGDTLSTSLEEVVFLQAEQPDFQFLSDVPPEDYRFEPLFSIHRDWQSDRSADGTALRVGGRIYPKGIGMFPRSRCRYRLQGRYRRLEGAVALDDLAGSPAGVRFFIALDGKPPVWQVHCQAGEPPKPFSISLKGVDRLELGVDFSERGNMEDYADWLDIRLIP